MQLAKLEKQTCLLISLLPETTATTFVQLAVPASSSIFLQWQGGMSPDSDNPPKILSYEWNSSTTEAALEAADRKPTLTSSWEQSVASPRPPQSNTSLCQCQMQLCTKLSHTTAGPAQGPLLFLRGHDPNMIGASPLLTLLPK